MSSMKIVKIASVKLTSHTIQFDDTVWAEFRIMLAEQGKFERGWISRTVEDLIIAEIKRYKNKK